MKTVKLIILALLIFASYGIAQNIPVVEKSVAFYADSLSQTITLEKSMFLSGIYMPASRTDSLWFQVYDDDNSLWYWLLDAGSKYVVVSDSTIPCYLPLKPTLFYPIKKIRILFNADIADTLDLYYDERVY